MAELSQSVLRAPRSGIREIMELASTVEGAVHLEVGEPLFETPSHIVEAGCAALKNGYTKYTPNAGMNELRSAIAESKSQQLGLGLKSKNVLVGIGGVEVINCAFRAFCEPGDEILIPDPSWPNYKMMATISNTVAVPYRLLPENNFYPNIEELDQLVTDKTKMLVINSPSNPVGVVFPRSIIEQLVDFANRHDIFLLSDEAYEKIIFDCEMVSPLTMDTQNRVIAAHTMSKTYAMTGWRIGYVIASEKIIQTMTKLQEAYVSSVPGAAQMAAVTALRSSQECVENMRVEYDRNRSVVEEILSKNNIQYFHPSGAFYMWISIQRMESTTFAKKFLIDKGVAVAPGQTFGETGEGWIRISLASKLEDLKTGISRLAEFMKEYQK